MALIKNVNTMVSDAGGGTKKVTTPSAGSGMALGAATSAYNPYPGERVIKSLVATAQKVAALEAELAGLKGAYAQSLAAYNAALDKLPQTYDVARNSVAGQNAIAQMNFDERAAASGLSSGAAAQAELARDSVYRGTLAGIDREQANAASEIELTKAKLQSQYESAIAQAKAGGDASLANALYQELVRVQGLNRDDEQRAQNIALQYGLKNGVSLGDIANIRSIADLANLTYYGSNGKYSGGPGEPVDPVVPGASSLISIPGYGEISYEDAERLEDLGYIKLIGADEAGNPIYAKTAKKQTENIALSR